MKEGIKVTEKEKEVLTNIVNSEFMGVTGEDMIGTPVWSWSATNRSRSLAGALGSLTKKRLVVSKVDKEGRTVSLTKEGFDIAIEFANEVTIVNHTDEVELDEIKAIEAEIKNVDVEELEVVE